ncbi:hypothetical protein FOA43_003088 [Brettanomyces nanus]|uniref:Uncharacterized protein n=1 Tax=Eeniella nana TaxID=13502 RepID=A0A875S443_EENNA|nr:uncharacterized protein FOA43_003088 [Brettanomyces nanus]QPG75728.1 hypothetical protein FOA43_003088 [Brettanomyces nanus]
MNPIYLLLETLGLLTGFVNAGSIQPYPMSDSDISTYASFRKGDMIPLECTKRQIDTGEHFFDEKGNIIYIDFPICRETRKPPLLYFGVDQQFKCTIHFEDKIYHLFQLYLHQDAPFSCRLPVKPDSAMYIPFTVQMRGDVLESHFNLDPNVNLLLFSDNLQDGQIVSGTSFSSSVNTTRVIIGDFVELNFDVRWTTLKQIREGTEEEDEKKGIVTYRLPEDFTAFWYSVIAVSSILLGSIITLVFSYKRLNRKLHASYIDKVE